MKLTNNLGMLLLGIYLILTGLQLRVGFPAAGLILRVLAIAAGAAILVGR